MLRHLIVSLFLSCSCVTSELLNLREGSTCMRNGVSGQCVSVYDCLSSYLDFVNKDYAPICSFRGKEPIVCCSDCTFKDTRNFVINPNVGIIHKTGQKVQDKCIEYIHRLDYPCKGNHKATMVRLHNPDKNCNEVNIVNLSSAGYGGVDANREEFPHMGVNKIISCSIKEIGRNPCIFSVTYRLTVSKNEYMDLNATMQYNKICNGPTQKVVEFDGLYHTVKYDYTFLIHAVFKGLLGYGDDIATADWLCGGTVISERFILTAGHCLSSPIVGPVKYAALGILKRTDPPELWQIYNVKRRIPHPEYKPPSKYHDIALLETDTEITFSKQVLPACLHATGEAKKQLYATGWGALGHRRELADTLQKVLITRIEEDECSNYYPRHRHLKNGYNHTTQMCYGDKNGKDTCEGDSGGPLQTSYDNNYVSYLYCVYKVFGVTSYGRQCGIAAGSGVYTRVIHYIPWIESIVWP